MPNNRSKPNIQIGTSRVAGIAGLAILAFGYLLFFLAYPLIEGTTETRSRYVVSVLLLPDLIVQGWFGDGKMQTSVLDRLPILAGAALWLGVAFWIGSAVVALADRTNTFTRGQRGPLATLVGLALLSTTTLVVGLAGQLTTRWTILAAIAAQILGALIALQRLQLLNFAYFLVLPSWPAERRDEVGRSLATMWASKLVVVLCVAIATIYVLGSSMPPWEFDVVEYHLQAPKEFYLNGTIAFLPHNIYANMPLGAEMHALAAMTIIGGADAWWTGGLIGKLIIGCHSLLAAWLLGSYVAQRTCVWIGWVAAGLLLACPGNGQVAMAGLVDSALGAYILATVVACSRWSTGRLFLASVLAGAAAACKYPGLLYAVVPLGFFSIVQWMRVPNSKNFFQWSLACLAGLGITCGAWYAKNLAFTGNPVYPLAYSVFGGRSLNDAKAGQWASAHRIPTQSDAATPYTIGSMLSSLEQIAVRSPVLQPAVMVLLAIAVPLCFRDRSDGWSWFLVANWILTVWWLATHRIDRFWLPVLPLWSGVASLGADWLRRKLSPGLLCVIALTGLVYGALMVGSPVVGDNRFFVSLSALRNDVGVPGEVAGRIPPAVGWINQNLEIDQARIGLIGEARVFDFRPATVYSTCFDTNPIETLVRGRTPQQQSERLHEAGVTHLLINWTEIARYRSPGNYGFSVWPTQSDIQAMIDSRVVVPVRWSIDDPNLQLLMIAEFQNAAAN